MDKNLTFHYDKVGDIFYIDICSPYPEQESEEIGDEIVARLNPQSGEVENLEILFFSKRLEEENSWQLPVNVAMKLIG
ncbi:MAG: DUF2283 domain-containing protein [Spirulinaceae cyanobacterium]